MESTNEIKREATIDLKPFKTTYSIIYALMIAVDVIIIVLLFTIWANLELIKAFIHTSIVRYVALISLIIKVVFDTYELLRFSKSNKQDKERVTKIAKGSLGTRIYRIYYVIVLVIFIIFSELEESFSKNPFIDRPGESEYLAFYFWFAILLYIHFLPIIIGPQLIKFSIDTADKVNRIKVIVYTIVWILVLILLLNLDFFILIY